MAALVDGYAMHTLVAISVLTINIHTESNHFSPALRPLSLSISPSCLGQYLVTVPSPWQPGATEGGICMLPSQEEAW